MEKPDVNYELSQYDNPALARAVWNENIGSLSSKGLIARAYVLLAINSKARDLDISLNLLECSLSTEGPLGFSLDSQSSNSDWADFYDLSENGVTIFTSKSETRPRSLRKSR
ncbi:MAG TPA: hypothetical protein VJH92_05465 [Candidatus Nanoarchaeia archaeon]|nr:hypothetical protein [Candidatus Nanoarchaeia archaeon]